MDADDLNLPGTGFAVVDIAFTPILLLVRIASTAPSASCPLCGCVSDRVPSRYVRTLADLPAHDRPVVNARARMTHYRSWETDPPGTGCLDNAPSAWDAGGRSDPDPSRTRSDPAPTPGDDRHDRSGSTHGYPRLGPTGPLHPRHRPAHRVVAQHHP